MSRDKQNEIHELAKQMSEAISTEVEQRYIEDEAKLRAVLIENGWRKASEVAREIFEEIEEIFNKRIAFYTDMKKQPTLFFVEQYAEAMITNCNIYLQEIAELKKKYTESEEGECL
jgi:hypothetical protein